MSDAAPPSAGTGARRWPVGRLLLAAAVLVVVLVVLVVFAVAESPTDEDTRSATAGLPDLRQDLAAHEWLLDRADSSLRIDDANPVTIAFDDDRVGGLGPCNAYRGVLSVDDDGDTIEITELVSTGVACDVDTMRAEDEYFAVLQAVRDVELSGGYDRDRVVLTNDAGDRLAFTAIDLAELVRGTWLVTGVARGDAMESPVQGSRPTITFEANGDLVLETGCNQVRGEYELIGDRLLVNGLSQTFMECPEPPAVMEQEQALVRALERAERLEAVPERLVLLDGDGRIVLVALVGPRS